MCCKHLSKRVRAWWADDIRRYFPHVRTARLMPNHTLMYLVEPLTLGLCLLNNPSYLFYLFLTELHITAAPIFLQPTRLRRAYDGNHPLTCNPRQRKLRRRTSLLLRQSFDLLHDRLVLVKVLTLEFRDRTPEIVLCKVVRRRVIEVIYQPAMTQR